MACIRALSVAECAKNHVACRTPDGKVVFSDVCASFFPQRSLFAPSVFPPGTALEAASGGSVSQLPNGSAEMPTQ